MKHHQVLLAVLVLSLIALQVARAQERPPAVLEQPQDEGDTNHETAPPAPAEQASADDTETDSATSTVQAPSDQNQAPSDQNQAPSDQNETERSPAPEKTVLSEDVTTANTLSFPEFGNKESVWGKAYLHYRLRPEFRSNRDYNSDSKDEIFRIGQRARVGLGVNYKNFLKTFIQLQDTRSWGGENTSVSNPTLDGTTALHQAWAEIIFAKDVLSLKVGRQQLVYGDQRLIGHLEWLDQGRVFDAARFRIDYKFGKLDIFESVFTPSNNGDLVTGSTHFFGAYNTMSFLQNAVVFDIYVLGLIDAEAARKPGKTYADDPEVPGPDATALDIQEYETALQQNLIDRHEVTIGTRLRFNHRIVKAGVEVAGQFGKANESNDTERKAVALHADVGAALPLKADPFFGVEFNYATGDRDPNDNINNQFNNLFPTNHVHYGFMDLASWSNTLNFAVRTGLSPSKHFKIKLDYWFLAKARAKDQWYNASGVGTAGVAAPGENVLGHELDLTLKFPIAKPIVVVAGGSIFIPTTDLQGESATYQGDPQTFAYCMLIFTY